MSRAISGSENGSSCAKSDESLSSPVWRQKVKWLIYALLLINFVIYIVQDAQSALFTVPDDASFLDWTSAFTTSIDLAAWFVLIAFFELETWVLSDEDWKQPVKRIVQGGRLLCIAAILHTTYADTVFLIEYYTPERMPDSADVCDYADEEWSFLINRGYYYIDEENCATLAQDSAGYVIGGDPVLTDAAGLREHRILGWTDLIENVSWLLIFLISEILVRNYEGFVGTRFLTIANRTKAVLYSTIVCIAFYWGSKMQILYFYDELLWVGGFLAIEGNLYQWRGEVLARRTASRGA